MEPPPLPKSAATAGPKSIDGETRFHLFHQKVDLDLDFSQQISGRVEIEIHPDSKDFKYIYLNARQCKITNVAVNGVKDAIFYHMDPCENTQLHFDATVHQHHVLAEKIEGLRGRDVRPNLIIQLPPSVRIREVDEVEVTAEDGTTIRIPQSQAGGTGATDTSLAKYTPLIVSMDFSTIHMRDSVQFVTGPRGSGRWPHAYTRGKASGDSAATLFPCVDSLYARGTWEISITAPQTVGDALAQSLADELAELSLENKTANSSRPAHENKEMIVICSGEVVSENISKNDPTKKIVSFACLERLSARQIGFAVGPFERVDLTTFRDPEDQDRLGDNAVQMFGYCLPRRSEEVRNTCLPTTKAMDHLVQKYSAAPFQPYSMCFIEDLPHDVSVFAGMSICSTRLLYPEEVIDTAQDVTRKLVHAIASQWMGINVIPETPYDTWIVVGIAHFLTELFMRDICGINEYRSRMRDLADQIFLQDRERPSIYDMGEILHVDHSAYDFIALKAPVVLFILDRRMAKTAGAAKMPSIISKILTRARTGDLDNNTLSTDFFQKTAERVNHNPINDFMVQWVRGAGCPHFNITQRFNKKKLTIEMMFEQIPPNPDRELDSNTFMRDVREDWNEVYAGERQNVFTGPMTIRIHEADGTPYEHIVQIDKARMQIDVPYNTKYTRLKRTRKARNKPSTKAAANDADDEEEKALVHYLGDNLQTEDELKEWDLVDWSQEVEAKMAQESFEWIRADADFEWIARIDLGLPGYMYASQLQQDRDIISQLHAMQSISRYRADKTVSSILLRTLMDRRYFHRVRSLAAQGLINHAHIPNDVTSQVVVVGKMHLEKAFSELFCSSDSGVATIRPNDFSDHQQYLAQLAIVEAFAKIRDSKGHAPRDVKAWILDKLRLNDNSANDFSDAFYVATLMRGLAKALIAKPPAPDKDDMDMEQTREQFDLQQFEQQCIEELDRYRRMDEWASSYQNLYSRTALECQALLAHAGIYKFSPLHFLQYTRPGNYDMLRLAAYHVLVNPNIFQIPSVLKYVLHCMVADSSPLIRIELQQAFGRVLGQQAIGDKSKQVLIEQPAAEPDTLVIEDTANAPVTARADDLARRSNVDAALHALKREIGSNNDLKSALWTAAQYSDITLDDLTAVLDFCRMLYVPKDEVKVKLDYPRYWKVQNMGKGKLVFSQTNKIRTKIVKKWEPPKRAEPALPPPPHIPQRTGSIKLKIRTASMSSLDQQPSAVIRTPIVKTPIHTPTPTPPPPPARKYSVQPPPREQSQQPPPQQQQQQQQKRITLKLGMGSRAPSAGSPQ